MGIIEALSPLDLALRPLIEGDIQAGCRLSAEAGWNQSADDWRHMIAHGLGWAVVESGRRVVVTAMILPYGDELAWICMVLVTADRQRNGIATALLGHCIAEGSARGWTLGLDATEAGRQVYLPLGFKDIYPITRLAAQAPAAPASASGPAVRAMTADDLSALAAFDERAFGAERALLLAHLLRRAPALAWIAEAGGDIAGYCLGREGRVAEQIGPVVAQDAEAAMALLSAALASVAGRAVFIDLGARHKALANWLAAAGFAPQRSYMRMLAGRHRVVDTPQKLVAIA